MKNKLILIFAMLGLSFFTNFIFAQQSNSEISFSVTDENKNFFADLKESDIRLMQGKNILPVSSITKLTDQNIEIIVMIDESSSQEKLLPLIKKTAQTIITSNLKNSDQIGVVGFTGEVKVHQQLTKDFQLASQKVDGIQILVPKDNGKIMIGLFPPSPDKAVMKQYGSAIWDSIINVTQNSFTNGKSNSKRAIMLLSDGNDNFSKSKRKDAIEALIKSKVSIYAFGIGDDYYDGVNEGSLKEISFETGGKAFFSKNVNDLSKTLNEIEQSLRFNYVVKFNSPAKQVAGKRQEIKIEVVNPELRKRKLSILQTKGDL